MSGKAEQKSFGTPDETRTFDYGALDLLQIGGGEIGRLTLQPGWRWSDHVRPLAFDARPGDVTALPQGHDAWVVGDEPVVVVDWFGASNYARG